MAVQPQVEGVVSAPRSRQRSMASRAAARRLALRSEPAAVPIAAPLQSCWDVDLGAQRRDDVAPVDLELGFFITVHEVQVELVDPGVAQGP